MEYLVPMTSRDWPRLGTCVRERRRELGLTQGDVAARGGPSTLTQRYIEGAQHTSYNAKSLRQLEDALGWARGSVRDVLAGGEPRLAAGERLGQMLTQRRLDLGGLDRQDWCAQRGIDQQLAFDTERGLRAGCTAVEAAERERAYELIRGAIADTLAGGPLEVAPEGAREVELRDSGHADAMLASVGRTA